MTDFTFVPTIPTTGFNPSSQYITMQQNNDSALNIWDEDHVGFNAANGGTHKSINFYNNYPVLSLPMGEFASVFPDAGTNNGGASGSSSLYLRNSSSLFLLNAVKAFASVSVAPPSTASFISQFGCTSVSYSSGGGTGTLLITLNSNVVTGNNVVVLVSERNSSALSYSFSAGVVSIVGNSINQTYDIIVLQA